MSRLARMISCSLVLGLAALALACGGAGNKAAGPAPVDPSPYLPRRAALQTKLVKQGPAPQAYELETPGGGAEAVNYPSGNLNLRAWVRVAANARQAPAGQRPPALVFFHGGFAFGAGDMDEVTRVVGDRCTVMCPTLRGENGNPGNFELFLGEVDDGVAAVKWLAEQNYVDRDKIYAFGHSVGGGIAALLSLMDGVPLAHTGSSGGLYDAEVFDAWDETPFDKSNPAERRVRLLLGNVQHMQRPHYAYLGQSDELNTYFGSRAQAQAAQSANKLSITIVPGDHFTSFAESLERYCGQITGQGVR